MSEKIKLALASIFAAATLGASINAVVGRSEEAANKAFLEEQGYKIENYEGKANLWQRSRYHLYAADNFEVTTTTGKQQEVVVGRILFMKNRSVHVTK